MAAGDLIDPPEVAATLAHGVAVADVIATGRLGRDSIYRLIRALGIKTFQGPGDGGRGRIAWISDADAMRLNDAAAAVTAKRATIGQYEAQAAGALVQAPQTLQTVPEVESAESAATTDGAELLRRIDAAAAAAAIGFPLTTAETAWILGARPGAAVVTRGGLTATRTARNVWRLSAESAEG